MKIVKILGWIAGGVVVLLVAVGIAVAVLFDAEALRGKIEQIAKEKTGRTLKLDSSAKLSFFPSIGAALGKVRLSERGSDKDFVALESAHVSVRLMPLLRGETVIDEVRIAGLQANVVKGLDGKFNFDDLINPPAAKAPASHAKSEGLAFDISGVRIERSKLIYRDDKTGQQLAIQDIDLRTGRIAPGVPGRFTLSAVAKGTQPAIDANLKLEADYQLSEKTVAVSGLAANASIGMPQLPQKTLQIALTGGLTFDRDKQVVAADLAGKVDESTIKAKLGHAPLTFDLTLDKLDVDRYMPPKSAAESKSDAPIDLSALRDLRADGRIAIGALTVQRLKLADVKAQINARDGRLSVAPHSASLYGGTASGALTVFAQGNRIALKETLTGIALAPLLNDAAGRDPLDGKANVTLDLTTAGATADAFRRALAGTARVELKDGAVKGINLAETLRKTKAMLGSKSAAQQSAQGGQKTDFSEMTASFVIRNGVARNEDLDAKAPLFRLGGAGDIDIGNSTLNYLAKAAIVATSKGQGGAGLDELAGLTVPVKLSGPFDAVKYDIDYAAMASGVLKSRVVEKLGERLGVGGATGGDARKGSGGDAIKEGLRGLFNR